MGDVNVTRGLLQGWAGGPATGRALGPGVLIPRGAVYEGPPVERERLAPRGNSRMGRAWSQLGEQRSHRGGPGRPSLPGQAGSDLFLAQVEAFRGFSAGA